MDFVIENIYWLVIAAAGLVQWWKSTQEAKEEARRNTRDYDPEELEEFLEEAERAHPRPAVPPPLPQAAPPPALARSVPEPPPIAFNPLEGNSAELERQAKLAEQLKQVKKTTKCGTCSCIRIKQETACDGDHRHIAWPFAKPQGTQAGFCS